MHYTLRGYALPVRHFVSYPPTCAERKEKPATFRASSLDSELALHAITVSFPLSETEYTTDAVSENAVECVTRMI